MPEAAFDLDNYLVFRQDDVGVAWKIARMETEPESEPVKCVPHKQLGLRIFRADASHVRRTLCGRLFAALPLVCHIVIMRHSERIGGVSAWGIRLSKGALRIMYTLRPCPKTRSSR